MIIDAFKLEARMNAIIIATLKAAATVGMSTATTDEGKRQQWDMYLAKIEGELNDVRDDLTAVRKGVAAAPDYIRATVLGTRPAQPDTALELSLARILGRRDEWTTAELLETIRPILGTPLCAELVAELEAREQVKWDELEPQLPELAPELSAYRRALPFVAAAVDQLEKLAAEMEKATEFETVRESATGPKGRTFTGYTSLTDYVGGGVLKVNTTGEIAVNYEQLGDVTNYAAKVQG